MNLIIKDYGNLTLLILLLLM